MAKANKTTFKQWWAILKRSASAFSQEECLKYSASLAYYTVFSLGPILVLMIALAGIFYGEDAIKGKVFYEINGLIGNSAALQVQEVIKNLQLSGKSSFALVVSIVTLLVAATSVFGEIQNSIDKIWHVRAKPKKGWIKMVKDRLLSSSLIIGLGFLLVVTLVVNGVILAFTNKLFSQVPYITLYVVSAVNMAISFGVVYLLFCVIFKVLPDVEIQWRTVRTGAFFTALLFLLGRYLIGIYLENSSTESTYGAAGSIMLILLWVYYTAAILYFGALFTREFAKEKGIPIKPSAFAVYVEIREREADVEHLPVDDISPGRKA